MEKEEEQIQPKEPETNQKESGKNRFQASVEAVDFNNIESPEQILNLL
jgi:hypothetical protein